ncbi:MAG TPA: sporulation transcription factor Spo0A [Firmicutes bacterium]|nr:sporulation transcription factor Spo0A [Bacillota bacterium]
MRILIVDNNVELCQVLEEYLSDQQDLEVAGVAYDGEEALAQIETLKPDVVLLDITMPYLDGIGVLEKLNSLELKKRPKVIVITAFGRDALISRLTTLGADFFILKPFRLEMLAERIRQFSSDSEVIGGLQSAAAAEPVSSEYKVTKLLHQMGVPPHYKGFSYLREAVLMCVEDGYLGGALTKEMYPALAEKYKTTSGGVEAAIRNAVIAAWENGNTAYIKELCHPHCEARVPTNSLIIAKIAEESMVF